MKFFFLILRLQRRKFCLCNLQKVKAILCYKRGIGYFLIFIFLLVVFISCNGVLLFIILMHLFRNLLHFFSEPLRFQNLHFIPVRQ